MARVNSMRLYYFLGVLLLLASCEATAVEETWQAWPALSVSGNFSSLWQYNFQTQARIIPAESKVQDYLLVPSIAYRLVPGLLTFWQGFTWQSTNVDEDSLLAGREERPWQRLDWRLISASHFSVLSGSRLEERKEAAFSQWAYRYRQKITLSFPAIFSKITPMMWDEVFFNLNQPAWVAQTSFEQNRVYLGFNLVVTRRSSIDLGYLNQYQFREPADRMNQVVFLQLNLDV